MTSASFRLTLSTSRRVADIGSLVGPRALVGRCYCVDRRTTNQLWVLVILLAAFREERPSGGRRAGVVVGFVGVAVLLGPWRGLGGGALPGHLACAGAALCYGLGFPYTRRYLAGRPESGVVL